MMQTGRVPALLCWVAAGLGALGAVAASAQANAEAPDRAASLSQAFPAEPRDPAPRGGFWLDGEARQGSMLIGQAPSFTRELLFNGAAIPLTPDGFFLIGFDRDAPAGAVLFARLADGRAVEQKLAVAPGKWRLEQINADFRAGASDAEFARRRPAELARINAARRTDVASGGWRQHFIMPARGRISGLFGSQRIYRGKPGSYHGGTDIAAGAGAVYVAPADGVVVLAADEPFTLEGKLLIIDHGMGLTSAFLHSSELLVREGDIVKQGQAIGRVGATGRASGPHLHWGMKWNSARIDPLLIVARQ